MDHPIRASGNKQGAAINLNHLPEANCTRPFTFDINRAPVEPLRGWPFTFDMNRAPVEPFHGWPRSTCFARGTMEPEESEPALPPSDITSAPAAVEPAEIPVTDAPTSTAEAALASIFLPNLAPVSAPVSAPVPAPAPISASVSMHVPVAAPAPPPEEAVNQLEERLMGELEGLGFMQADLNKQILRQNNYDLEQSVVDLCSFNEWDPLGVEFSELVSMDMLFPSMLNVDAIVKTLNLGMSDCL